MGNLSSVGHSLPEPYPEEVRRARWAPFWEALRAASQAHIDAQKSLLVKQSRIRNITPFAKTPDMAKGFPERVDGHEVLRAVLVARAQGKMGEEPLVEALRLGARLEKSASFSLLSVSGLTREDFVSLVGWGLDPFFVKIESGRTPLENQLNNPPVIRAALDMGIDPFVPLPAGLSLEEILAKSQNSLWGSVHTDSRVEIQEMFDVLKEQRILEAAVSGPAGTGTSTMPRL
jgi:hypothetical protein